MCLLAASVGLYARDMPIDILAQIGFVVLLGLAAKNAILIVEFAKPRQHEAGSEMRQSLGTAVFAGMLGVTVFGLLFTPAFYTIVDRFGRKKHATAVPPAPHETPAAG